MKKAYRDYQRVYIGESERAELTLRFFDFEKKAINHKGLHFGGDNVYMAYLIQDESVKIPKWYQLEFESNTPWLDIIDDMNVITFNNIENIKIYRAGDYGCIICLKHLK